MTAVAKTLFEIGERYPDGFGAFARCERALPKILGQMSLRRQVDER
jgi:hypothetical protein